MVTFKKKRIESYFLKIGRMDNERKTKKVKKK